MVRTKYLGTNARARTVVSGLGMMLNNQQPTTNNQQPTTNNQQLTVP
ncbi:hypothetical protein [Fischerella muscicola]|nr:hypothetical protein [Fischerella muscicola]